MPDKDEISKASQSIAGIDHGAGETGPHLGSFRDQDIDSLVAGGTRPPVILIDNFAVHWPGEGRQMVAFHRQNRAAEEDRKTKDQKRTHHTHWQCRYQAETG